MRDSGLFKRRVYLLKVFTPFTLLRALLLLASLLQLLVHDDPRTFAVAVSPSIVITPASLATLLL
jgi:hypothetical protein